MVVLTLLLHHSRHTARHLLGVPGGFCDADETASHAVARECAEEIGVIPTDIKFIGAFPNTYEYNGITYKTCDMYFTAHMPAEYDLRLQDAEVASTQWYPIDSAADIEKLPLAFDSLRRALMMRLSAKE